MATNRFGFTRNERLHLSRDFKNVFRYGDVWRSDALTLFTLKKPTETAGAWTRMGIIVPRKTAGAVQRNRLKRRLREIFRLNKGILERYSDMVIIGREKAALMDFGNLEKKVFELWRRAKLII
jgi:ribonuclease P protein component